MRYIVFIFTFIIVIVSSCDLKEEQKEVTIKEKCPCDSIGVFDENNKKEIECYFGKSLISIKQKTTNDTLEITRYYTEDNTWHVQEYIVVSGGAIIYPNLAMYCNIADTSSFYKLSYVRNEDKFKSQGIITNQVIGLDVIINNDTIKANSMNALVPKYKFKGIVKVEKILDITYKHQQRITRAPILIDAESMAKYGNLLAQYKAINNSCLTNSVK
jgi:hypothetical protein